MKLHGLFSSLTLVSTLLALPAVAETSDWAVDPAHSRVGFSVPHLMVSEIEGQFKTYSAKVALDESDLAKSQVEFSAETASIDTGNADRDKHLKSPEFFDAPKFPQLTFKSTKITKAGKGYKLKGVLTIHGVSKEVTLDAAVSQPVKSPMDKLVRAVKITAKLKRGDFGLTWNKTLDQGGLLIGDDVLINVKLELNK